MGINRGKVPLFHLHELSLRSKNKIPSGKKNLRGNFFVVQGTKNIEFCGIDFCGPANGPKICGIYFCGW